MKTKQLREGDLLFYSFSRPAVEAGDFRHFLDTFGLEKLPRDQALRPLCNSFVFILSLDEHLQLMWRVLRLSRPRRSLIEAFQRSGLLHTWESLGPIGRDSAWGKVWRGTFEDSRPPRLSRREPDEVFALFLRNRFLGAILVLEEFRLRKRDDAFELVNSVQGTWGSDPALRQLIALTARRVRRKDHG